jgi:hypothetical protein
VGERRRVLVLRGLGKHSTDFPLAEIREKKQALPSSHGFPHWRMTTGRRHDCNKGGGNRQGQDRCSGKHELPARAEVSLRQ